MDQHSNGSLDEAATIQNAKQFLKDYSTWNLKMLRWQQLSQFRDLTPTEKRQATKATLECQLREKTLVLMNEADETTSFFSDLLTWRYLNGWSVTKVCQRLADHHQLDYLSERTYMRDQQRAMLRFAKLCPRDLVIRKKPQ